MQIVFTADVNTGAFRYEALQSYDLDKPLADRFIAQGVARLATSSEGDAGPIQALVSGAGINSVGLSGVGYDGSNRVTSYTLDGVAYTVAGWGTGTVTISGSNGSTRTLSLDGSGRFTGVA